MIWIILTVCLLTAVIHGLETISYAIRLAGIRTGKLAVALSLTGMLVLVSRTSNLIQAPLSGMLIDRAIADPAFDLLRPLQAVVTASSIGTLAAMLLIPGCVALSMRLIDRFEAAGSVPELMRSSVSLGNLKRASSHFRMPTWEMLSRLRIGGIPKRLLVMNVLVTGFYTVGVLASLYASFLVPEHAMAASQSSGLINGIATIVLTLFIDPQVALLTDRVMRGETPSTEINKMFGLLLFSRLCGTLLAQLLLVPSSYFIAWCVKWI